MLIQKTFSPACEKKTFFNVVPLLLSGCFKVLDSTGAWLFLLGTSKNFNKLAYIIGFAEQ